MSSRKLDPVLEMHRQHWPETFDLGLCTFLLALHRTRAVEIARTSGVMTRHQLSLAEFDVLTTLRRYPPPRELTPTDLQRSMVITSGGLTKVLRQLEERGLVIRSTADGDRRVKPVRITAKASRLIEQAMVELLEAARGWIQPALSKKETEQLTGLLLKLSGSTPV